MTADPGSTVWGFALDLVAGLGAQGVEVVLATLGSKPCSGQRRDIRAIPNVLVAESDYRVEWMIDPWEDVRVSGDWLLTLASRYAVDVVHCNHLVHANLPWDVPVLAVGHSCARSWTEATYGTVGSDWDRYAHEVGASLRAASAVVAPTRAMLSSLEQHYGPITDGAVIHSACRPMPHASLRKESRILSVGRLTDESKNFAALNRVAPSLAWPVHIAGPTGMSSGDSVSMPNVDLLGSLTTRALSSWIKRAAIFALPSKYEPSGLTVLNAARAGCALVLGDIPALRELWDGAALFVPTDDDAALTNALQSLIDDPQRRAVLARAARQRALVYGYERCVLEYLLAYRVLRGGYERLYDGVLEAPYGRLAQVGAD
ncbi:MAG TPA: glycosyltransferase family 4 protein [Gemmatimonas sp.]|nr:glycosyltransferase family 4 protein [Gemmatimonas sp.]